MKKKVGTNNKIESVFVSAHIWLTASYMHTYTAPPRNIYMNVYTFWAPERDECYYTFFRATYFHFHFLHRKKIARCKNGKKRLLMREHFCDIYINDDFSLGKLYESLHRFINKCVLNCRKMPFPPHSSHTMASTRRKKKKTETFTNWSWAVQIPSDISIFCSELLKVLIILIYDVDYYGHNPQSTPSKRTEHTKNNITLLPPLRVTIRSTFRFDSENNVKYHLHTVTAHRTTH